MSTATGNSMQKFVTGEKPWTKIEFALPNQIPTMITAEERRYLHWLGKSFWTGRGALVEIGPWLGGSTYCLGSGMAQNAALTNGDHKLYVYDSFEWRPFMAARANLPLAAGDSFQPFFERNVAPFGHFIVAEQRVLPDDEIAHDPAMVGVRHVSNDGQQVLRWNADRPIEVLFIDGAKSWDGFLHLLRETHASLVPGVSLLVCQDYKHWGCYWVPAIVELLSGSLQLHHLLDHNTVAFLVTRDIQRADIDALPNSASVDAATGARLLESAATRLEGLNDPFGAALVRLAKVHLLAHKHASAEAIAEFRRVEAAWTHKQPLRALEETRDWLATRSSTPLPPSLRARAIAVAQRFNRARVRVSRRLRPALRWARGA